MLTYADVCGRMLTYGVQDEHIVARPLWSQGGEHANLFAVFDGHGGDQVLSY